MAQDLIARFCPDGASLRAAIDSLCELRSPAATVFSDGVRSTDATVVDSAIQALGELGGTHAATLLLPELLRAEDTRTAVWRKRNAAQALLQIADSTCGPALLAALPQVQDLETKIDVVETLERIEYRPAGDAVLALLAQATTQRQQAHYAKALASLRHAAAIPLLRQKYGDAPLTGTSLFGLRKPSVMGGPHADLPTTWRRSVSSFSLRRRAGETPEVAPWSHVVMSATARSPARSPDSC